jgi:hypothetical protein
MLCFDEFNDSDVSTNPMRFGSLTVAFVLELQTTDSIRQRIVVAC